ncbi:MAG TPA: alpha/beta fold hydrolase [Azospirillaceae bacterium]|nr:alpha/beta fold hydrolase [Azospirillaceae bacterium]
MPALSRPSLVLLPGLLCDRALWEHQVAHLGELAGIAVPDLTRHDSVADMARHVLAEAPERFALAGLSMGGYVALEIMRQAPERVDRLCLVDTSARADSEEQSKRRRMLMSLARTGKFKGVTPSLLPMLLSPVNLENQAITGTVMAMAERVGRDAFLRHQTAILARPDSRGDLGRIACPTLVIVGREDALTPPDRAEEMASGVPGARLAVIEQCGHLAPLEQPQATTALMRQWLLYP